MKIYESITIDIATGRVLEEKSYEYDGPIALCEDDDVEAPPPPMSLADQRMIGSNVADLSNEMLAQFRGMNPLALAQMGIKFVPDPVTGEDTPVNVETGQPVSDNEARELLPGGKGRFVDESFGDFFSRGRADIDQRLSGVTPTPTAAPTSAPIEMKQGPGGTFERMTAEERLANMTPEERANFDNRMALLRRQNQILSGNYQNPVLERAIAQRRAVEDEAQARGGSGATAIAQRNAAMAQANNIARSDDFNRALMGGQSMLASAQTMGLANRQQGFNEFQNIQNPGLNLMQTMTNALAPGTANNALQFQASMQNAQSPGILGSLGSLATGIALAPVTGGGSLIGGVLGGARAATRFT